MGLIWNAAKRGEGRQLAIESNITWLLVGIIATCHGIWRFFSGRPLLGDEHRKTHATWSDASRVPLKSTARPPGWWSCLAEKHRAAIRVGLLVIGIGIVWGWWSGPFDTFTHSMVTIAGIVITWTLLYQLTKAMVRKVGDRRHRGGFIEPLKKGVAPILGINATDVKVRIANRKTLGG
jgi:hypothetical protein